MQALEKRVTELEQRQAAPPGKPAQGDLKEMSVKEFMLQKRPSNDVEKTLAIAYFLEKFAGLASFNVDDLGKYFQLAKEATPTNLNDKVNLNIKKGHLAEAKEKKERRKAWIVTNSGEKFVEGGFSDQQLRTQHGHGRRGHG
jgi:hypothetical protein